MKTRLTELQFRDAVRNLDLSAQTLAIAHGVLVEGLRQTHFVETLGLTKGAVSQAVSRVREAAIPKGYRKLIVILPERQAEIVETWAKEAEIQQGK
jgi:predicted transcriptional regulator